MIRIGVLALQGAFREHVTLLKSLPDVEAIEVRTLEELCSVSGLIIPGGESTTMALIAERWGLTSKLKELVQEGLPIWGTCAGLIFLADRVEGQKTGGQSLLGGLDVSVHRNFFGAQVESFEAEIDAPGCIKEFGCEPFRAVFIRAPAILSTGPGAEIISNLQLNDEQQSKTGLSSVGIAVRSSTLLATAFHPELTGDVRWTKLFVSMVINLNKLPEAPEPAADDSTPNPMRTPNIPADLPVFGQKHIIADLSNPEQSRASV